MNIFTFETTPTETTTISANSSPSIVHTVPPKTGYTPVCVVGYEISGSGSSVLTVYGVWLISSGARLRMRNNTSNAITATTQCRVMYIKTELL